MNGVVGLTEGGECRRPRLACQLPFAARAPVLRAA